MEMTGGFDAESVRIRLHYDNIPESFPDNLLTPQCISPLLLAKTGSYLNFPRGASPALKAYRITGLQLILQKRNNTCYNPQACIQMKDDWNTKAKVACQDRTARLQGYDRLKMSKAVVVGDLNVGKTCLINRFCKDVFERDYKATIGVDFEIERFEMSGLPYSLQIWDTAGQEKFKCIASAYYRGAQVIITVFDMADIKTLEHTQQWLSEALKENEPNSCFVFLVGTKRDLLSAEECQRTERDAIKIAAEMNAEFWSVSSKTGENISEFFFRVAALAFEDAILNDLETGNSTAQIGDGNILNDKALENSAAKPTKNSCC